MKKVVVVLSLFFLSFGIHAQEETLIADKVEHDGYGALVLKFARMGTSDKASLLVGGQGSWLINHSYGLGAGAYSLTTQVKAHGSEDIEGLILVYNYGGFLFSYIYKPHKLVHFEANTLIGGGEATYRDAEYWIHFGKSDLFAVVEPGLNVELNVTPHFRITGGLTYRVVKRINLKGLDNGDVSGLNWQLVFKFGSF